MSEQGAGRARGFGARGRSAGQQHALGGDEGSPGSGGSGGNGGNGGNGGAEGASMRGRGGFVGPPLRTIPSQVQQTAGEGGQVIPVMTNYFRLITPQSTIVYQYHVDFEPPVESTRMKRGMLMEHRELFGNAFLFDGQSNIKSTTKLGDEVTVVHGVRRTDSAPIEITIKFTGEIGWGHWEMLRLYNTQMRRNLNHLKYILVGRHFFDPRQKHQIREHQLEIWQGLLTALNEHDGGILMVCDTVFKVVRTDTVHDILTDILHRDRGSFQESAKRELGGSIVMTSYNNKTYRIDDIAFDKNPTFVFERRHGAISIKDYYQEQYKITIRDEKQPLIVCNPSARDQRQGRTEPILLVPELCAMTGLTESLKNNMDVRKQMTNLTRAEPQRRVQNLYQFMQTLKGNENVKKEMQSWGLNFDNNVVELPARVLPCEKLLMAGDTEGTAFQQKTGDFSKEIRGKGMKTPAKISEWVIIVTQRDRGHVDDFASTLNRVCQPMGVQMNRPTVKVLDNDRTGAFVEMCNSVPPNFKIVVIIVPNNNKDRYDAIKKIFCCEHPMASQVIVSRTLSKKGMLMSVCTKIGIQMAVKLGGEPWSLVIPPRGLMVVGFDTYHDSTRKKTSIGGFVCSLNQTLTRWYSRTGAHENNTDMSNGFAANFTHGLKRFHELNGKLPERVIVYRDGVSEGQIPHVFEIELQKIKDAIKHLAGNENIRLAFVIVTKRISARFFWKQAERQVANPIPGTIVDTVVTRRERFDYYLVSQSVRQGTVSPTMYNIIEDETNWKPHHHQQLSYKLCHLYFNWMGTISVPAPCQYAHKLAFLTGTALHREPSVRLADTLFYL
ncbi:piwi-like protein 1 [Leptotrombidium deliense]|uniref:Piwi-like protein 1 n=1 Tax=Leptotrombidium deliense TaxID=299467 RepID=A0A443SQF4_9ACAR|nr:piwi-like protein 1 [Leptotrombidium deliense]